MLKWWLKVVAGIEVLGGIIGAIYVVVGVLMSDVNIYTISFGILGIIVFSLSLIAGITLWKEHRLGKPLSIIIQLIQLPKILSPVVAFSFSFGFDFYVIWTFIGDFSHLGFNARFLEEHILMINDANAPFGIGISIISCVFLGLLFRMPSKKRREMETVDP
jgi:hypothetical protein